MKMTFHAEVRIIEKNRDARAKFSVVCLILFIFAVHVAVAVVVD